MVSIMLMAYFGGYKNVPELAALIGSSIDWIFTIWVVWIVWW